MSSMRLASNIRTFLLALVLGIAVWVSAVSAADPDEVQFYPKSIPIEIVGQDPTLVLTNELPSNVEVKIRAPRTVWDTLTSQDNMVRAILDLTGLGAGEHNVDVQVQITPRPTQIVLQNPQKVTVKLEPFMTQTLPLTLTLSGQPAAGYQAGQATLAANDVVISGPESLVKAAVRARVNVSLDGIRDNVDEPVGIQIID